MVQFMTSALTAVWHLDRVRPRVTLVFSCTVFLHGFRPVQSKQHNSSPRCDDYLLSLLGHISTLALGCTYTSPLWENLQPNSSHVIIPLPDLSVCTITLVAPRRLATPCQTQWRQPPASILALLIAKWTEEQSDWGPLSRVDKNMATRLRV